MKEGRGKKRRGIEGKERKGEGNGEMKECEGRRRRERREEEETYRGKRSKKRERRGKVRQR